MTGPPFAPHPTGADSILAHAEGLAIYAGGSYRLAGDVRHAFAAAQAGVSGVLVGPMLDAPRRFYDTSDQLHLATMYAAGCVTLFAAAVRDFDAGVERLNAEWEAACGSDFDIAPIAPDVARTPHGIDSARLAELESDWAVAIDTARRELAADLRRRYHRLQGHLDEAAHDVAMRLRRGPTDDAVHALVQDGAFRQLFDGLARRLDQLTPDPPSPVQTMQKSGTPYICDDMGCRPTYNYPVSEGDGSEFGTLGDLVAGTIGGVTETVDQFIPDEIDVPTFIPAPGRGAYTVDLPDQPLTDPYEDLVRTMDGNPDSDLYTVGQWLPLPTAAGGIKLTDRLLLRYARKTTTDEAIDAAEDLANVTRLVPGGGLAAHEGTHLGHTLRDHVGLADNDLLDRVLKKTNEASSFTDRATAERAIHDVLKANEARIQSWLAGKDRWLTMNESTGEVLGRFADKATLKVHDATSIRVVIYRDPAMGLGYYIKTAFPRP